MNQDLLISYTSIIKSIHKNASFDFIVSSDVLKSLTLLFSEETAIKPLFFFDNGKRLFRIVNLITKILAIRKHKTDYNLFLSTRLSDLLICEILLRNKINIFINHDINSLIKNRYTKLPLLSSYFKKTLISSRNYFIVFTEFVFDNCINSYSLNKLPLNFDYINLVDFCCPLPTISFRIPVNEVKIIYIGRLTNDKGADSFESLVINNKNNLVYFYHFGSSDFKRESLINELSTSFFTLVLHKKDKYIFNASGVIFDSILFLVPLVHLNHPQVRFYERAVGEIGESFDSLAELNSFISNLDNNYFQSDRYLNYIRNLDKLRRILYNKTLRETKAMSNILTMKV